MSVIERSWTAKKNAKGFVGFLSGLFVVIWHFVCLIFFVILSGPSQIDLAFCLNHEI